MLVAAIHTDILLSPRKWDHYLRHRLYTPEHNFVLEYCDHNLVENSREFIQFLLFLAFYRIDDCVKYCVFNLPDGRKSFGVPVHITPPDQDDYEAILGISKTSSLFCIDKLKIKVPVPYRYARSLSGRPFDFSLFESDYQDIGSHFFLPTFDFLWGDRLNNHAVFVLTIDAALDARHSLSDDPEDYLSEHEFLELPDRDELSTRAAQWLCKWTHIMS